MGFDAILSRVPRLCLLQDAAPGDGRSETDVFAADRQPEALHGFEAAAGHVVQHDGLEVEP